MFAGKLEGGAAESESPDRMLCSLSSNRKLSADGVSVGSSGISSGACLHANSNPTSHPTRLINRDAHTP